MLCRHCERPLTLLRLKCPTCRTRQPTWYLTAALLSAAAFVAVVYAILRQH
ncbi:MAG TPA: hypothetical protein VD968_00965 [Pyrinomonadaceae bacterium]|nr:hypothetical protein [Pyrinomonadaceae bacterium]